MSAPTLIYPPVRDGYQFHPAYGVIETRLDGGASRKRMDVLKSAHTVQLSWVLQAKEYTDFMGFFSNTLQSGSLDFKVSLLTSVGAMVPHIARCVGTLPYLTANQGNTYFISAVCEVDPNPTFGGTLLFGFGGAFPNETVEDPAWTSGPPSIFDDIFPGNSVQVFLSAGTTNIGTSFNLDGTYTVSSSAGGGKIEIAGAAGINSSWAILASGLAAGGLHTITSLATAIVKFPP